MKQQWQWNVACVNYINIDGDGGKQCAEYCAANYCQVLSKHLRANNDIIQAINDSISELDNLIMKNCPDASGSTATIVLIDRIAFELWVINIGDSQCIKICDIPNARDDDDPIEELSIVHRPSDEDEKQRILAAGGWVIGCSVMGLLAVSRALGDADFKLIDDLKGIVISKHGLDDLDDLDADEDEMPAYMVSANAAANKKDLNKNDENVDEDGLPKVPEKLMNKEEKAKKSLQATVQRPVQIAVQIAVQMVAQEAEQAENLVQITWKNVTLCGSGGYQDKY